MLDFKKIAKSIHRNAHGIQDPRIMHTTRDWWIAILIFISLSLLGSAYLWALHSSYYGSTENSDSSIDATTAYQADLVERALNNVAEKQGAFETFANNQIIPTMEPIEVNASDNNEEEVGGEEVEESVLLEEAVEDIVLSQ